MTKDRIRQYIEHATVNDGLTETQIDGFKLFRATSPVRCAPAVYEPCVIAIVSGEKEALLEGARLTYDRNHYMCCPMSMPVKAGTPNATDETPLFGVYISLDQRLMSELVLEMDTAPSNRSASLRVPNDQGIRLARWDPRFTNALLGVLQLGESPVDAAILGQGRMRELHYAILLGEAGQFARQAFGAGNGIARSIAHVSSNFNAPISIEDMANRAGLSRAVFHRKFKQATAMSPMQFVKSMRLNNAAQKIAGGMIISQAAMDVGYQSASQFSREFKRMYGQSPRQWSDAHHGEIAAK